MAVSGFLLCVKFSFSSFAWGFGYRLAARPGWGPLLGHPHPSRPPPNFKVSPLLRLFGCAGEMAGQPPAAVRCPAPKLPPRVTARERPPGGPEILAAA